MKVQSFGERIVLFILNVVIFGRLERNLDDDDMFFLPHSVKEEAKILWRDGAAVGFYTTKRKACFEPSLGSPGRSRLQRTRPAPGRCCKDPPTAWDRAQWVQKGDGEKTQSEEPSPSQGGRSQEKAGLLTP
ncbi:hypothetical protein FD754_015651 [Muntiacus muntjak]|uniref:Uncharacterized protein n=1 Tax=Muntiacus muntjak TaxID=9888 RepID=A0A5N3VNU2_MUNMU|nr:hypothetical protein FD754_015651 [Muntiacus muntjak]